MGRANPFSPWSDSCDPHEESHDLVWKAALLGWLLCSETKLGGFIRLLDRGSNVRAQTREYIYRLMFPQWLIVYYHAYISLKHHFMCVRNFIWPSLDGLGLQEALGALCVCSAENVFVLEWSMRVSVTERCHKVSQTLLPSLSSSWAGERLTPFCFPLHTPTELPQLRIV